MSKWIHTTLNDICRSDKGAIISGPFGSNISSKFFVLDGVPVIRGNNLSLSLDKFYDDDFVFVTEEKADELNCYAEEGDLIFTAAGTIGQVGILEAPLKYKKYVISNKQLRARIDTRKVDLLYAYYWFASAWMQNYFIRNNKGSTVPLITLSELKDAPISYPEDITEQKKIAMAIEAISRKINNNRNICFNLESMAKTLYDYWFTQFDFPNAEGKPYRSSGGEMVWNDQLKREIPKGWDTATINEMTKSCRGVSYDKNDLLPSPENGVLVLRGNNIQNNRLVYDNNVAYVPHSLVAKEQQISAHDIILTMSSGSKDHIGKCTMFQYDSPHTYGAFLTKFTPDKDKVGFVYLSMISDFFKKKVKAIGERAGSGIPNIFRVWREQNWTTPEITEQLEPERTTLTLLFSKGDDKKATIKSDDKKTAIKSAQQKEEIIAYLTDHISARSADIAELLGVKSTRAKQLLSELTAEEIVVAKGGNRNRTYQLKS